MNDQIADWTTSKSFRPRMTLVVEGELSAVRDAVVARFVEAGYNVADQRPDGVRLTYVDWFGVLGGTLVRTAVAVEGHPDGATSVLLVSVEGGGESRQGRKRGQRALNAAVADLERDGLAVTMTPWSPPDGE
ncbi:MAG: hypothetical protein ACR2JU_07655 [Nocardioidaceae bacterium]